jgi:hypothetical protein
MDQQRGRPWRVKAMAADLNETDCANAACVQIGGKFAQDPVRIVVCLVDEGGEVALGVEHDGHSCWRLESTTGDRGGSAAAIGSSPRPGPR